ncbi:hypothetical protein MPSEU_000044400 [Mayamaea pseudoterrestris]|nr:hypothetical protein MPSEU_000044400 [Mayamaea pseudoterrestris]
MENTEFSSRSIMMRLKQAFRLLQTPASRGVSLTLPNAKEMESGVVYSTVICPALSLLHPANDETCHGTKQQDRKEAEQFAARLLQRAMLFSTEECCSLESSAVSTAVTRVSSLDIVPQVLLQNILQSFYVLIDCRVRAYASFMARATSPVQPSPAAAMETEQALVMLLETGRQMEGVHADSKLRFYLHRVELAHNFTEQVKYGVSLQVGLNVLFGHARGELRTLKVELNVPGHVQAACEDLLTMTIELDTQQLLLQMIDQASLVVAAVADFAKTSSIIIPSKLSKVSRSSSYLMMPPPPSKTAATETHQSPVSGLDMLSQAAVDMDVPKLPPNATAGARHDYSVYYDDSSWVVVSDDDEDQVVTSNLSPEQCASIVDGVFGLLDTDNFCLGPPAKRFKPLETRSSPALRTD